MRPSQGGGGLYGAPLHVSPPSTFDFLKSFDVLMIVVLGGLGNLTGTLVASFVWVFLLEGIRVALRPSTSSSAGFSSLCSLSSPCWSAARGLFGVRELPFFGARCTVILEVQGLPPALRRGSRPRWVDFTSAAGELVGIIGPTDPGNRLFNVITGIYRPTRGRSRWRGGDHRASAARDHPRGNRADLPEHTPLPGVDGVDNVRIAHHRTSDMGPPDAAFP